MEITILVVDDNEDTRYSIRASLSYIDKRYVFLEASNAEECIKEVAIMIPDIILMDILLPGMSGFETAAKLKEDCRTHNIPIIFLSGKNDPKTKNAGFVIGDDFIEKPFTAKNLDKRIKLVLERYGTKLD